MKRVLIVGSLALAFGILLFGSGSSAHAATSFTAYASATPTAPVRGQLTVINATVKNLADPVSNAIVDLEVWNLDTHTKVFQRFFTGQNFGHLEQKTYSADWTPSANGRYWVKIGVFSTNWTSLYFWKDAAIYFVISDEAADFPAARINVWTPGEGMTMSGIQPIRADIPEMAIGAYQMFWRVDGDQLNSMYDSGTGGVHKEAMINYAGWNWRGAGPYSIDLIAKDMSGSPITFRTIQVRTAAGSVSP